ncbi:MAG: prepilin-type N-terminal cleavage/methylation domain-containing protein [Prosthecobacter sp.]
MKLKRPNLRTQAFSLIELLVVITIIAILGSLALSQFTKTMESARKLQVQTVIKDLRIAITSYQVEYNRYPVNPSLLSSGDSGEDIPALETDQNSGIVDALTSTQSSATGSGGGASVNLNPKDIKFIDLPTAKNGQFGLVGAEPPYKLTDLWGSTYRVLLDTNGDRQVTNPDLQNSDPSIAQNANNPPPEKLPTEVAIYSIGLDKTQYTKDDITSWRTK